MSAFSIGLKKDAVSPRFVIQGDYQTLFFWGSFTGGAALKLQVSPISQMLGYNNSPLPPEWFDISLLNKTSKAVEYGIRMGGVNARWVVVGGDGSTLLNGAIVGIK